MPDDPRNHRWYMLALGLAALFTAPVPFIGRAARSWLGLPVWLWWSAAMTLLLASLAAWGIARYWRDPDE